MTMYTSDEMSEVKMKELKCSVEKLRSSRSTSEDIRDAFSTLLLMPTVLGSDEKLASIGTSRQELRDLSKQHSRVFRQALKKFIGEAIALSRH